MRGTNLAPTHRLACVFERNGVAAATFVALCLFPQVEVPPVAQSLARPASGGIPPFPLPFDSQDGQEEVCYPIGQENCDTCELNEDWTEYYGEPIWMCASA